MSKGSRKTSMVVVVIAMLLGLVVVGVASGSRAGTAGFVPPLSTTLTTTLYEVTGPSGREYKLIGTENTSFVETMWAASSLVGKPMNQVSILLKKTGTPTGTITVGVLDATNAVKYNLGTISAASIGTTERWFTFFNAGAGYTIVAGDRIGVKYVDGTTTSYISAFGVTTNPFEGVASYRQRYDVLQNTWISAGTEDLIAVIGVAQSGGPTPDDTNPTITITSPTPNALVTSPVIVTGTASDPAGIQAVTARWRYDDGVTIQTGSYIHVTPRAPGDFSTWTVSIPFTQINGITVSATDKTNNPFWNTIQVVQSGGTTPPPPPGGTIDTAAPIVTITTPATGFEYAPGTTLVVGGGTAVDNVAVTRVEYSIDGGVWQTVAGISPWTVTLANLSTGTHAITVRAFDSANNQGVATSIFIIAVATPAPTCPPGYEYNTGQCVLKQDSNNPLQFIADNAMISVIVILALGGTALAGLAMTKPGRGVIRR